LDGSLGFSDGFSWNFLLWKAGGFSKGACWLTLRFCDYTLAFIAWITSQMPRSASWSLCVQIVCFRQSR
jgi:hypothetical protein